MNDVVESSTTNPPDSRPVPTGDPTSGAEARIQELKTAIAARDSFIAMVGHELRNSMAPMVLLAEQFTALAEDPRASPVVAARVAVLTRNLSKLVATVDRVAEAADLRRGKLRLELRAVNLVEVVEDVCRELGREAGAAGASLAIDAAGPVTGLWDRGRLKQIVASLISNAFRHGGPGRVDLIITAHADRAELVVRDQGPGIDPAAIPTLFDAFDHEGRHVKGLGIGLWLVKTLCTAMLGSVTAQNHAGGGACFFMVLPRG